MSGGLLSRALAIPAGLALERELALAALEARRTGAWPAGAPDPEALRLPDTLAAPSARAGAPRPLHHVPHFDLIGGLERQAALQAAEMARRGLGPLVLTESIDPELPPFEARQGFHVARRAPPSPAGLWPFRQARTLRAFLWRHAARFDVLHAHAFFEVAGTLVEAARALGIPAVVKVASHGDIARLTTSLRPDLRAGLRGLGRARRFIAISAALAAELHGAGFPAAQVTRIPNGVDAARFRPGSPDERRRVRATLGVAPDARLVVFVGRLDPGKAVDVLLRAFARVRDPLARLAIVGEGPERPRLERLRAGEPSLGERVLLLGARGDVPDLLGAADVFAFLSRSEGQPNAVIEAMAAGLAPVVARIPGVADLLDDATAALVPPDDVEATAAALSDLLANPARRRALGDAARARVERDLSVSAVVDRIVALYEAVIEEARTD